MNWLAWEGDEENASIIPTLDSHTIHVVEYTERPDTDDTCNHQNQSMLFDFKLKLHT